MKKITTTLLSITMLLVVGILFNSCGSNPTPSVNNLTANPTSLSFVALNNAAKTVAVTTNATSWNATRPSGDTWLTITKSGSNLTVEAANNTTTSARNSTITLTAGDAPTVTITVTQAAGSSTTNTLSATPTSLSFVAKSNTAKTVTVTTNATSWISSRPAADTWLTISQSGNTLTVNATDNTGAARTSNIILNAGDAPAVTITVTQAAGTTNTLSATPTSLSFVAKSNTAKTVTVTTSAASWTSSRPAGDTWLTISQSGNTLTANAADNTGAARTSTITLNAGDAPAVTISVSQEAATAGSTELTYDNLVGTYTGSGESYVFDIESVTWESKFQKQNVEGFGTAIVAQFAEKFLLPIVISDSKPAIINSLFVVETQDLKYQGYPVAFIKLSSTQILIIADNTKQHVGSWDGNTRTIDFSGKYTHEGNSYDILIGIAAYEKATGNYAGQLFSDGYKNLKFVYKAAAAAPATSLFNSSNTNIFAKPTVAPKIKAGDILNVNNLKVR